MKATALLLGVFLCGGVVGGMVVHVRDVKQFASLISGPPHVSRQKTTLWALDKGLRLTDEQRAGIAAVLRATTQEALVILAPLAPQLAPIRERAIAEARALLTPAQQHTYDQFIAKARADAQR